MTDTRLIPPRALWAIGRTIPSGTRIPERGRRQLTWRALTWSAWTSPASNRAPGGPKVPISARSIGPRPCGPWGTLHRRVSECLRDALGGGQLALVACRSFEQAGVALCARICDVTSAGTYSLAPDLRSPPRTPRRYSPIRPRTLMALSSMTTSKGERFEQQYDAWMASGSNASIRAPLLGWWRRVDYAAQHCPVRQLWAGRHEPPSRN